MQDDRRIEKQTPSQESICLLEFLGTLSHAQRFASLEDFLHSSLLLDTLKELDPLLYSTLPSSLDDNLLSWQINKYLLKHVTPGVIIKAVSSTQ